VIDVAKKEEESKEVCSVCLEALYTKRVITFDPCKHIMHRTCGIRWLETRDFADKQCCPICRTKVDLLIDKTRRLNWNYLFLQKGWSDIVAFGPFGQPTKYGILNHSTVYFEGPLMSHLGSLITITKKTLRNVNRTLEEAKEARKRKIYISDIKGELEKLKRRSRILADMMRVWKRRGMRYEERKEVEVEWNYKREREAL
ncbi:hypothetical protein PENTCL1PPCAC_9889, partial [Pristionchus entomophagus]